jgi:membrane protease YdiL (CAAX protease family)
LSTAIAVTLPVALLGLITDRLARWMGWDFPSVGYLVGELIWKAGTLGVLFWAIRHIDHDPVDRDTLGLSGSAASRDRFPTVLALLVGVVAVGVSALVGSSAGSASSFGTVHHAGLALGLAELLVRYPLTVMAEETFFRGWMQPRLGSDGPVLAALLWAAYHLQQVATIPSLVIVGLFLGLLRWMTGNVRLSGVLHYISDAAFFISTYM